MFYYSVFKHYNKENKAIYSFNAKIEKNSIVVIPNGLKVDVAKVEEEVDAYTAMSENPNGIEPIICVLDLKEFNKRNEDKFKAYQIEQIMEEKMDIIKRLESYRKIAEKNSEFKEIFLEYERLKSGGTNTVNRTSYEDDWK